MEELRNKIQNSIVLFWEEDNEEKATEAIIKIFKEETEKQLSISRVMQWVAVEDKLPPKYENVIVRNENDIVSTDQISDNGWVYEEMSCLKVTHWMYLPKPPCA